ncbi:F-box/kelch-repeat protein At3g27150-like isoform X1 [Olea europaea var. sylvestris]|uniref:F-box/kelch-repeat protein At3g27150-like isoform X1 n=2 Tax=Olea europaea var. sylvestris TaxID=158386 RepID=UPI000C1CCF06|nr:F-box/kelch-repeat protein At3g27150-like isoform X1 [Olea europaea var. sylvestris]XP_022888812.1 F-box/kelch-repeat protein At3g27150-like isoform X1 [Olea europaea var. sylvestris]XP_022888813.1 F-box/kelch-repeat protein At3g27150-like isoform X2 [Olea europaea var. sylvestris]XP_022888814.1 F-box/kelch-repeat protein At3g27150-like isoform X1 [Olea europaea var. sylvestris]
MGFLMKIQRILRKRKRKRKIGTERGSPEEKKGVGGSERNHWCDLDFSGDDWITIDTSDSNKVGTWEIGNTSDQNVPNPSGEDPHDADYSHMCHWCDLNLCFVNKRGLTLLKSSEHYNIRKENGVKEPSVFMLTSGEGNWLAFDREFRSHRKLPVLPSDPCFSCGDKETLCAGTHLLVSGREIDGLVIWRYELAENKWYKGPSMTSPRCLFASATCGTFAYVAGGMGDAANCETYDTAEKYNSGNGSWEPLPRMKKRRRFCSGCYMDHKFYVIGGRNDDGELTCGEFFDETKNTWELIPDMLKDIPRSPHHSPPLLAVVNNELFLLECSSNKLKVYLKKTNSWKALGRVPVRSAWDGGWGIAFLSLGNELLVVGPSDFSRHMAIYTCSPDADASELQWRPIDGDENLLGNFIYNCCVMVA